MNLVNLQYSCDDQLVKFNTMPEILMICVFCLLLQKNKTKKNLLLRNL